MVRWPFSPTGLGLRNAEKFSFLFCRPLDSNFGFPYRMPLACMGDPEYCANVFPARESRKQNGRLRIPSRPATTIATVRSETKPLPGLHKLCIREEALGAPSHQLGKLGEKRSCVRRHWALCNTATNKSTHWALRT